jgi:selenide,water dikinase
VYRWEGGPALVQTVDFFTPIVDDPRTYGQIAAANALSDIYAMGARPVTALAIAGFPEGELDDEVIREVFLGGYDTLRDAGVVLLGGHTVRDNEVKFGYAVTGAVDPARILTNASARAGDVLFLTKPLGTGIIGTAIKFGRAPEKAVAAAVASMTTLNRVAADVVAAQWGAVHACTDITGFGLLGHASEMAAASAVTLEFRAAALPLLPEVLTIAGENRSGGLGSNREHFAAGVRVVGTLATALLDVSYDPQTSGGLLLSVAPDRADALLDGLQQAGVPAVVIGRVAAPTSHRVLLLGA